MYTLKLQLGPLETNCWLVADTADGAVVIIDPATGHERIKAALAGRDVAAIVLTHGHFDHLGATAELVASSGAPLLVSRLDAGRITTPEGTGGVLFGFDETAPEADRLLEDGDTIATGRLSLQVMLTPGHTEGSISLFAEDPDGGAPQLFSGDTLFAGSVGRTDFAGGDPYEMRKSIALLAGLPDETLVHPGHGPDTTIARERKINPFFPRA